MHWNSNFLFLAHIWKFHFISISRDKTIEQSIVKELENFPFGFPFVAFVMI